MAIAYDSPIHTGTPSVLVAAGNKGSDDGRQGLKALRVVSEALVDSRCRDEETLEGQNLPKMK